MMKRYMLVVLVAVTSLVQANTSEPTFSEVQKQFCTVLEKPRQLADLNTEYKIKDTFLAKTFSFFKHVPGTGTVQGDDKYKTSSDELDFFNELQITGTSDKYSVITTKLSTDMESLGTFKHKLLETHGRLRSDVYRVLNTKMHEITLMSGLEYQFVNMDAPLGEILIARMQPDATETDIIGAKHLLTMHSYYRVIKGLACDLK